MVQEYHLDTNHHVNNGQYVRMATAYLPETFAIRELRVEYRSQAMLGDTIRPVRYEMPDGYLATRRILRGKAYCAVHLWIETAAVKSFKNAGNLEFWRVVC